MSIGELIKDAVYTAPLSLLIIKEPFLIDQINSYLPYSTGFEIECNKLSTFDADNFRNIPDIMDVQCDVYEQRFRIPSGLRGLICLYNISQELKINSELNPGSGIHYHVDMSEYSLTREFNHEFLEDNRQFINTELDSWGYKGTYNHKDTTWVRRNEIGTIEYRIGEMTFDYNVLVKRIIHVNSITKVLKVKLGEKRLSQYIAPNADTILKYMSSRKDVISRVLNNLNRKLKSLNDVNPSPFTPVTPDTNIDEARQIIQSRINNV